MPAAPVPDAGLPVAMLPAAALPDERVATAPTPAPPVLASEFDSVLRSARTQAELEPEPWWTTPIPAASALPPALTPALTPTDAFENPDVEGAARPTPESRGADLELDSTLPPPLGATDAGASAPDSTETVQSLPSRHSSVPSSTRATRIVIWVGVAVLAVIVLVGLFLLGQRLAGSAALLPVAAPTASATPTATPTPTPTPEVTAMQRRASTPGTLCSVANACSPMGRPGTRFSPSPTAPPRTAPSLSTAGPSAAMPRRPSPARPPWPRR
ncbi:hypothetical protein [Cryobacterium sp. MLB-32]|uniref:hypothetical protein n=1 Tax=Cryobacterium sp. MLB-32 TaxID=1529318 RepID=UPI0012E07F7D|nr:hypothetical protein [Cryobacterium sp. MLB-32]